MLPNASKLSRITLDFQKIFGGSAPITLARGTAIAHSTGYAHFTRENSKWIFLPYMKQNFIKKYARKIVRQSE